MLDVRVMRSTVPVVLLSLMLISCGISYRVPQATLHIDVADGKQFNILQDSISDFLIKQGFTDLGKDEEMLELLERSSTRNQGGDIAKLNAVLVDQIDQIHRTRRFSSEQLEADVVIIDYSDPAVKKRFVDYSDSESEISGSPALELHITNYRPGGFSAEVQKFYKDIRSFISSNHNNTVNTVHSPPATNQHEFYKVSAINLLASALWWSIVYAISIGIFGSIIIKILQRTKLAVPTKRAIFALSGTLSATPLPFPAASIAVVKLPSLLALPEIGSDYFLRIKTFAIPSFIVSAALCLLVSFYFIKSSDSENI